MTEFYHRGAAKRRQNQALFAAIAPRYDFLNHLLSLGLDFSWRRRLVQTLPVECSGPVLDVATGTGDLAFALLRRRPDLEVTGVDDSPEMLHLARRKRRRRGLPLRLVRAAAEDLPFPDGRFAAVTIAFGLRNIGFYAAALREFYRVLQPGGLLLVLEFGRPRSGKFAGLFRWYFQRLLPRVGILVSGSRAYRYLPESVAEFPSRPALAELVTAAGFAEPRLTLLSGGVVTLLTAKKRVE